MKHSPTLALLAAAVGLLCAACEDAPAVAAAKPCGADATLSCSRPTQSADYYVDQAQRYFDALDVDAPAERTPTYAPAVLRWEWPPWLKLTGYTAAQMHVTDKMVKQFAPARVTHRDCRAFARQPFARCRVSFDYLDQGGGKPCFIYEEFAFNDAGAITFIEAWSDLPGLSPIADPSDPWGERSAVHRLSVKVPGLGSPSGAIDPLGPAMQKAAAADAEVADLVARTQDFWPMWTAENDKDPNYFAKGCGW